MQLQAVAQLEDAPATPITDSQPPLPLTPLDLQHAASQKLPAWALAQAAPAQAEEAPARALVQAAPTKSSQARQSGVEFSSDEAGDGPPRRGAEERPEQPTQEPREWPLPPHWEMHWSGRHHLPYFWNTETRESRWIRPVEHQEVAEEQDDLCDDVSDSPEQPSQEPSEQPSQEPSEGISIQQPALPPVPQWPDEAMEASSPAVPQWADAAWLGFSSSAASDEVEALVEGCLMVGQNVALSRRHLEGMPPAPTGAPSPSSTL